LTMNSLRFIADLLRVSKSTSASLDDYCRPSVSGISEFQLQCLNIGLNGPSGLPVVALRLPKLGVLNGLRKDWMGKHFPLICKALQFRDARCAASNGYFQ
jgi:hypothetical protein